MTDDFFRARIEQMIDLRHPLAVLAQRLPWQALEKALAPCFARDKVSSGGNDAMTLGSDLFGPVPVPARSPSNAGRPRLPMRLMISLLYLKHAFNLSDEELVLRWSKRKCGSTSRACSTTSRACRAMQRRSAAFAQA